MRENPGADGEHVDALLGADAGHRDVDRVDELRRGAVVDLNDGEAAMDTWITTKDAHCIVSFIGDQIEQRRGFESPSTTALSVVRAPEARPVRFAQTPDFCQRRAQLV